MTYIGNNPIQFAVKELLSGSKFVQVYEKVFDPKTENQYQTVFSNRKEFAGTLLHSIHTMFPNYPELDDSTLNKLSHVYLELLNEGIELQNDIRAISMELNSRAATTISQPDTHPISQEINSFSESEKLSQLIFIAAEILFAPVDFHYVHETLLNNAFINDLKPQIKSSSQFAQLIFFNLKNTYSDYKAIGNYTLIKLSKIYIDLVKEGAPAHQEFKAISFELKYRNAKTVLDIGEDTKTTIVISKPAQTINPIIVAAESLINGLKFHEVFEKLIQTRDLTLNHSIASKIRFAGNTLDFLKKLYLNQKKMDAFTIKKISYTMIELLKEIQLLKHTLKTSGNSITSPFNSSNSLENNPVFFTAEAIMAGFDFNMLYKLVQIRKNKKIFEKFYQGRLGFANYVYNYIKSVYYDYDGLDPWTLLRVGKSYICLINEEINARKDISAVIRVLKNKDYEKALFLVDDFETMP